MTWYNSTMYVHTKGGAILSMDCDYEKAKEELLKQNEKKFINLICNSIQVIPIDSIDYISLERKGVKK